MPNYGSSVIFAMQPVTHHILFFCLLLLAIPSLLGEQLDYPTANLSTVWINSPSHLQHTVTFTDGTQVRSILLRINPRLLYGPTYACGFFCNSPCETFLFAVFAVNTNSGGGLVLPVIGSPQVVWSANRNHPVGADATLNFTAGGDLILRDADGTVVWSTGTSGKSVVGMNITASGDLMLFDRSGAAVWQSFDHPTDTLVLGQTLREGQRLTTNISSTNWTEGQLYLTVLHDGLYAFAGSSPPQRYHHSSSANKTTQNSSYIKYTNGSLAIFVKSVDPATSTGGISLTPADETAIQFMRLESDGHLRIYEWNSNSTGYSGWQARDDVLRLQDVCSYPTVCGAYGICSNNGQCSCPLGTNASSVYFQPVDDRQSSLGCSPVTPLSCQSIQEHRLIEVPDVSYFHFLEDPSATKFGLIDEASCKQACLKNCSCRAAFFAFYQNISLGNCYLESQLFSLRDNQPLVSHYNSSAYIKVQNPSASKKIAIGAIIGIAGATVVALLVAGGVVVFLRRKMAKEEEEDDFQQVPGMPTRFSYEEVKLATDNFSVKLGEGGFGSVYEGKFGDEKIAVKQFKGVDQGKREFLAEVQTISSIHHINLVRLIGFCAEKSHRLLVYEHMCNGSLDRWIFRKGQNDTFDWQTKYKIIADIAKGLSYLHEECRQRIAHLDIKPQNILLDEKFNAKVADFGLAKLIDRDQEQVMTRMRGTPGYLAPEWLTSVITEKVDIYSFGVVVVEIICGRKNLDYSEPEQSIHLLSLLQEMIKAERWEDIVPSDDNDMNLHKREAIEMIKLAVWCLQIDSGRRPSMSTVVKVLEGEASVETDLDYGIVTRGPVVSRNNDAYDYHLDASPPPSASLLSGPR